MVVNGTHNGRNRSKSYRNRERKSPYHFQNYRKASKKSKSWLVACIWEIFLSFFTLTRRTATEHIYHLLLSLSYFFGILYVSYPLHLLSVYRKSQALLDEILEKIC